MEQQILEELKEIKKLLQTVASSLEQKNEPACTVNLGEEIVLGKMKVSRHELGCVIEQL